MAQTLTTQQWADLVVAVTGSSAGFVASSGDADWTSPVPDLEWSASQTLEHVASCLVGYAGQLTAPRRRGWVPMLVTLEDQPSSVEMGEVVRAGGGILAAAVATTSSDVRSYHPYGIADAGDFAAMGIIETLVHTDDLARTFGGEWQPDPTACRAVLDRLFLDVDVDADPWTALQWATGRIALPQHPRRTRWRWHNTGHWPQG